MCCGKKIFRLLVLIVLLCSGMAHAGGIVATGVSGGYAGSASCRSCHERFYQLWSTSRHGLTVRPYDSTAAALLSPQQHDLAIGSRRYRMVMGNTAAGRLLETDSSGAARNYPIAYLLGGKNVVYFLTMLERGRLQTLPLAYDVNRKEWFDTARSGLRHIPGQPADGPLDWQDRAYTFNSSCYGCHVSQVSSNYHLETDRYATAWKEPGINCETCHGPCGSHVTAMQKLPRGATVADGQLHLVRTKVFTPAQHTDACASCHAKAIPISAVYKTPEPFFDHFDLVTLENPDYYPDGRDLGENYTQTSWMLSACARDGRLHCVTCHTSSGRYRFKKSEDANKACLPCHAERVQNVVIHSHHPVNSVGSRCVSCHMPTTGFARMRRTDHSMRPPTPSTTLAYQSPNACNGCHANKDAAWADQQVRQWYSRDYQAPVLKAAGLIAAARKRDWSRLAEMLAYLQQPDRNEVFAASLIRMLGGCTAPERLPALKKALYDGSPLVRAATVEVLGQTGDPEILPFLLAAASDAYRVVRVRAAAALAPVRSLTLDRQEQAALQRATQEYLESLVARPDQWSSHYNLGNVYSGRGENRKALDEYAAAIRIEPQAVAVLVNQAVVQARLGGNQAAERTLQRAVAIAPDHAAAHFNLGLLQAERNESGEAEAHLKHAFAADPHLAQAAYDLCVLLADTRADESLGWCRKAVAAQPENPDYGYSLAFYLAQQGKRDEAITVLQALMLKHPRYQNASLLYGKLKEIIR